MNITGNTPLEVMASLNQEANGLIFISILAILWVIIFFRNNNEPARDAIVGATFITCIVGVLFSFAGLLYDTTLSMVFFLAVGAIVLVINRPTNQ